MTYSLKIIAPVVLPLFMGIIIYALFRGIPLIAVHPLFSSHHLSFIGSVLFFNLPDALWLYSLLQGLRLIWKDNLFTDGLGWVIGCIGTTVCSEFAQYYHIIPGTFDVVDIAAYLAASAVFILQYATALNPKSLSI